MKNIILILLGLFSCSCESSAQLNTADLTEELQIVIDREELAGFSVSIFTKDSILYQKGFGYSNLEKQEAYTIHNSQMIASISKTMVGVSLMKAQELGLLQLDDSINTYLPFRVYNPYHPHVPISIRHLATHSSSLKYSQQMTDHYSYEMADAGLGKMLQAFLEPGGKWYQKENFLQGKAGEISDYSNTGAALAAYIIERVSKLSFKAFTKQYLFDPLALKNTSWFDGTYPVGMSKHYLHTDGELLEWPVRKHALYPVGFLVTNVQDLSRFCQAIMRGSQGEKNPLLTPSSVQAMLQKHKVKLPEEGKVNLGIFWWHDKNVLSNPKRVIGHAGGDSGVYTMMYFDPKSGIGYIMLSNTGRNDEKNLGAMIHVYRSLYLAGKGAI